MGDTGYRVCNRLLDPETNQHCEFDGLVTITDEGAWNCPSCHTKRWKR